MSQTAPAVLLNDVTLALGGRTILDKVSLSIGAQEFIGVLGPNGAGKTSVMRAILGLLPPARGQVAVLGRPARRGNPAIGYLPQGRMMLDGMKLTGREVVAAAASSDRFGLPFLGRAAAREIDRALDLVDATGLARRNLAEMSGGERQRLLLAQALIARPRLLLLDEPLISLDLQHQQNVVALVGRLQCELGIAVLFSAHEINPLLGAIDRVLYLGAGQAALGTVEEVITAPVLSRLYNAPIDVVRIKGRIFVVPEAAPFRPTPAQRPNLRAVSA